MRYAICCNNQQNQILLRTIFRQRGLTYSNISNIKNSLKVPNMMVFIEKDMLEKDFFTDKIDLIKKIENFEWRFIVIGNGGNFVKIPFTVKRIENPITNELVVNHILDSFEKITVSYSPRELASLKKFNRQFYIYNSLYENQSINYEYIKNVFGVSERTYQRDVVSINQIINSVMPTLNKAHRLLYIYHLLNSTESISYEDVEEFNIGKRTFERDLETLREILITEKTTFNKYQNRYELKYVS